MNARHNNNDKNNSGGNQQRRNNNRKRNNHNKRSQNKNRRPKSLTPARIIQKYDNLMEQHIIARKKYFELHARVKGKQLDKIEQNFNKTLHDLRNFENGLKDWQREVLAEKINAYPLDRQYSSTHDLKPVGDEVSFSGDFEDPHLLSTQKEADYQNDTEESSGSMDDYYAYKGIDPPLPVEEEKKENRKH
tara:strand:- start:45219 stop:45788 length:570 start_codon:yes stop_codon:yes gene_type:complete